MIVIILTFGGMSENKDDASSDERRMMRGGVCSDSSVCRVRFRLLLIVPTIYCIFSFKQLVWLFIIIRRLPGFRSLMIRFQC